MKKVSLLVTGLFAAFLGISTPFAQMSIAFAADATATAPDATVQSPSAPAKDLPVTNSPTSSEQNSPLKILIVDLDNVLKQSKVGKSLRSQLEKQANAIQKKSNDDNNKINNQAKDLNGKRGKIPDADYNKTLEGLEKERDESLKNIRKLSESLRNGLENAQNNINGVLNEKIFPSILDKEVGILILPKGFVIAFKKSSPSIKDITSDVVSSLDKTLPDLTLKPTDQPPAPPAPVA